MTTRFTICCCLAAALCLAGCSDDTEGSKDTGGVADIGGTKDTGSSDTGSSDTGGSTDTGSTVDSGGSAAPCPTGKAVDPDATFAKFAGTWEVTGTTFCAQNSGGLYTANKKYNVIVSATPKRFTFETDKTDLVFTWDGKEDTVCQLQSLSVEVKIHDDGKKKYGTLTADATDKVLLLTNHFPCLFMNPVKK